MKRTQELPHDPVDSRQFELAVKQLADSLAFGPDDSIFHGSGLEYSQSRVYQPGDSVKMIDWKISARAGKFYVKEYQEPRQVPLYLMMDTSASMCVSSRPLSKYAWALRIAAGMALAAQARLMPVGLVACGQRRLQISPTLSRSDVMQWAHRLRRHGYLEGTFLGQRLRELMPTLTRRSALIVLSDLHDADAVPALRLVAQEHDCLVLHFRDPAETGLRGAGLFRGREAETGRTFFASGLRRWLVDCDLRRRLTRHGIGYLLMQTDRPMLAPLRSMLRARGRNNGGGR
jgi:uncharacterized protein (DUF58 family)